jgi:hypothetical protein
MYLALRGFKTNNKKPMLAPERAVKHATTIERCFHGASCRSIRGGARVEAPPPASMSMRAKPTSWSGTWTGTGSSTMQTKDGRSTKKSSSVEVDIAQDGDRLRITLEPRDEQKCTLEATIDGDRAELRPGQTCRRLESGGEIALTVREGSTLSLEGGELAIRLSLDLEVTDRSRKKARTARLIGSMNAIARRAR